MPTYTVHLGSDQKPPMLKAYAAVAQGGEAGVSAAPLMNQKDPWQRQHPEIPTRGLTTALGCGTNFRNKMPTEGMIIILINRHGAVENKEGIGNGGSLFINPHRLGGRREPGTEKLKIMSKERLKFIIQTRNLGFNIGDRLYKMALFWLEFYQEPEQSHNFWSLLKANQRKSSIKLFCRAHL